MENTDAKIYYLANNVNITDFILSARCGDKVELISADGEKIIRKFEAAGCRHKDLYHYVKLTGGSEPDIMLVNFKTNSLSPVTNANLYTTVNKQIEAVLEIERARIAEAKRKARLVETPDTYASYFTGGIIANYFYRILIVFVTCITLGLAYPAMQCKYMRWKVNHTYLNGRKLVFTGESGDLFEKYLIWLVLSVITFGIYYIVKMRLNLIEWETEHTHVKGKEGAVSSFNGTWYELLGVTIVHNLVTAVTLSFGYYWVHCYMERWFAKHKNIDGIQLEFNGTGMQFFGKCIVWVILTVVTCGIYSLWMSIKIKKWTTKHTVFTNPKELSVKPIEERGRNKIGFEIANLNNI